MNQFSATALAITSVMLLPVMQAQAADVVTLPGLNTTGQLTLSTDYRFRGVSKTSNNPAIQGALSFNHESGAYASIWGSNIEASSTAEMDAVLGYATRLSVLPSLKTTLDVGYIRYIYAGSGNSAPASNQPDFNELFAKLGFTGAVLANDQLITGVNYSNNYNNHSDDFWYVSANYSVPIKTTGYGIVAGLGYNLFSSASMLNRGIAYQGNDEAYFDYKLGTTFGVQGLTTELAWVGNSLKAAQCEDAKTCKNALQLSISKAF